MTRTLNRTLVAVSLVTTSCSVPVDTSPASAAAVRSQDLGDLPYHPLVFHMDLSILAYQVYSQSLLWPFDPYYEELAPRDERDPFMAIVRDWAGDRGRDQLDGTVQDAEIRGPGLLSGFPDNPAHDPILYQYERIHPWSDSLTKDLDHWILYQTPQELTARIAEVHLCTRPLGADAGEVQIRALPAPSAGPAADASDVLLVFEGGTGDKGEPGQPASQSLMGLALVREGVDGAYDVHIAFRGSRSGSASRAALEAVSTDQPEGNPDWITDLGVRPIAVPTIATEGLVARGMATSMLSILPQALGCLDQAVGRMRSEPPRHVYVTGHSLGGGLAQMFASAMLDGERAAKGGAGLPEALRSWPWQDLKLITYGSPRVGDHAWAKALTEDRLGMPFFGARYAYDHDAIGILDPDVLPRLLDPTQSAGYRVLAPGDPITGSYLVPGFPVGQSVYLADPAETGGPSAEDHEPPRIRALMRDVFRDPDRIPAEAWAYLELDELSPDRNPDNAGTRAEYEKLIEGQQRYEGGHGIWVDDAAVTTSVDHFFRLLDELDP